MEQPDLDARVRAILQLRAAGANQITMACDGSPLKVRFGGGAATPVQLVPIADGPDVPPEVEVEGVSDTPDPMEDLVRAIQEGGEHGKQDDPVVAAR